MKTILYKFITEHLFDATEAMLSHLHIRFTAQSKLPISFREIYEEASPTPMPQALNDVVSKISETYLIGAIDEDSLEGRESGFDLGKPIEGKYNTMLVFAVDIQSGISLSRNEIAIITRGFNRMAPELPVIVFIKSGEKLSLATCERTKYMQEWREGEKLGKVSILRDINCGNPHRGHLDILKSLGDQAYSTFDELYNHWLNVFSSELLTKKFYTELSEWYAWAINSGKVRFPNDLSTTEDDSKYNHEAVIRLITRLIFVWFLKQKNLIPSEFFKEDEIRDKFIENFDPDSKNTLFYNPEESKYYRLILQNLFFAMLNRPIYDEKTGNEENRRFANHQNKYHGISVDHNINNLLRYRSEFKSGGADMLLKLANSKVPFLNGGLFECLDDKDHGLYYDGFSEQKKSLEQLSFPDYFFFGEDIGCNVDLSQWYDDKKKNKVHVRGLINILRSYYFTVEENTPLDQEVSLDPELLGKVFENLLASYNPETNTTARKQTGSFYTPREIVKFMVDESLIAHLKHTCPSLNESIFRDLLNYSSDNSDLAEDDRKTVISALYNCKVLDPACGSGAFPMGILQQMVHVLRKLDPSNDIWREFILNISLKKDREAYLVEDETERKRLRADIEESFNNSVNDPDYARKLYLIENCIYGVDIQPIATQISKLRFFISLVAEQKPTNDPSKNFGIRPLPNLEAKFVSANVLLPLEKESNLFGFSETLDKIKKELAENNHKLFRAKRNKDKRDLRLKIERLRKKYSDELISEGTIGPSSAQLLADWNMFNQNASAPFFDLEWMFGMNKGFDIVIGNPPYVQLQKSTGKRGIDKKGKTYDIKVGDIYENKHYETFTKTGDLYCLFYEQGYNLSDEGGIVCYITSNKWMRAGYGEKLRGFFARRTNPQILVDFGGIQVFESATVDTNILIFSKETNQGKTVCSVVGKDKINGFLNLSDFVRHNSVSTDFRTSDSWVILSPIEQSIKRKIESVGVPLKDWDIQINYGIKTGYNDAFIISTEKRDEILSNCLDEEERQRTAELIRPILRGRDIKRYGYDWAGLWLIATFPARKYDIEQYPAVKNYLLSFAEPMLRDSGYDWVADKYLADFCKQKLSQTGNYIEIDGKRIHIGSSDEKARKATSNKWFETQDSISYWDDFSKPKIVYPETTQGAYFAYDTYAFHVDKTCFMMISDFPLYIQSTLSSKLFEYAYKHIFSSIELGETAYQYNKHALIKLPIFPVQEDVSLSDTEIYAMYSLSSSEIGFIESL